MTIKLNKGQQLASDIIDGDENEAASVYNEKAKELFGEYAYLNKLDLEDENEM